MRKLNFNMGNTAYAHSYIDESRVTAKAPWLKSYDPECPAHLAVSYTHLTLPTIA